MPQYYIVKDSPVREWTEDKYLTLKPDFSALYCEEQVFPFGAGFMGTKKYGTYTVDREKGLVTVKLTKSETETNMATMQHEIKACEAISEQQEYTLKALGV